MCHLQASSFKVGDLSTRIPDLVPPCSGLLSIQLYVLKAAYGQPITLLEGLSWHRKYAQGASAQGRLEGPRNVLSASTSTKSPGMGR